jgi:hypothetical protein
MNRLDKAACLMPFQSVAKGLLVICQTPLRRVRLATLDIACLALFFVGQQAAVILRLTQRMILLQESLSDVHIFLLQID